MQMPLQRRILATAEWLKWTVMGLLLALTGLLVVYPVGKLVAHSLQGPAGWTLAYYWEFVTTPELLSVLWNTLWVAAATTAVAVAIGVPLAWAVAGTNMPGRGAIRLLSALTLASPSFLGALAWVLLLGPRAGKLNLLLMDLFSLEQAPFNIFSAWGIVFVLAMFSYPLVFMPVAAALENMDVSLEDASRLLGAGTWRTVTQVTLPMVLPAILSGAILVFIEVMVIFGPPAVLGMPVQFYTLSTKMYTLMRLPPRLELAAVMSLPVILTLAGLLLVQRRWLGRRRFTLTTGKPVRPQPLRLGWTRYLLSAFCLLVVFVAVVLPFGTLLQVSLQKSLGRPFGLDNFTLLGNYRYLFDQGIVLRALKHSLLLAAGAVLVALVLGVIAAWMVERARSRGRGVLPLVMLSPFAFPGSALGVALILAFGRPPWLLAGSLTIIFVAYVVRSLPVTFSYSRGTLVQISPDLEEACRTLGGSWFASVRDVTVPLMKDGLLAAAVVQFVLLFRELSTSVFLYTGGNEVTAVVIYDFAQEAQFTLMAAFSVIVAFINLGVVAAMRRWMAADRWS